MSLWEKSAYEPIFEPQSRLREVKQSRNISSRFSRIVFWTRHVPTHVWNSYHCRNPLRNWPNKTQHSNYIEGRLVRFQSDTQHDQRIVRDRYNNSFQHKSLPFEQMINIRYRAFTICEQDTLAVIIMKESGLKSRNWKGDVVKHYKK